LGGCKTQASRKKGKLVHWLSKDEKRNVTTAYDYEAPGTQRAELSYRWMGEVNKFHLLEVMPITGRPHQIRVQLASMNCPIRGDVKYGYPKEIRMATSICMHAGCISSILLKKSRLSAAPASLMILFGKNF
jgi:23S rRNA-/tRNA-specific pseudouridylate synthase